VQIPEKNSENIFGWGGGKFGQGSPESSHVPFLRFLLQNVLTRKHKPCISNWTRLYTASLRLRSYGTRRFQPCFWDTDSTSPSRTRASSIIKKRNLS